MHLTGHELTLIPSGVAAIAIVGGYLGVRSANQTTIRVGKQERSSKRQADLQAQKRVTYVKLLAALFDLMMASLGRGRLPALPQPEESPEAEALTRRRLDGLAAYRTASSAANSATNEVSLLTYNADLKTLASEAISAATQATSRDLASYNLAVPGLEASMEVDLQGLRKLCVLYLASVRRAVTPSSGPRCPYLRGPVEHAVRGGHGAAC